MKAILVVDIPNDLKYEELYFLGEIRYTSEFYTGYVFLKEIDRSLLKPMPERKSEERAIQRKVRDLSFESGFRVDTLGVEIDVYAKGYNACIDQILGEEE